MSAAELHALEEHEENPPSQEEEVYRDQSLSLHSQEEEKGDLSQESNEQDLAIMNEITNPILFTEFVTLIGRIPISKHLIIKLNIILLQCSSYQTLKSLISCSRKSRLMVVALSSSMSVQHIKSDLRLTHLRKQNSATSTRVRFMIKHGLTTQLWSAIY